MNITSKSYKWTIDIHNTKVNKNFKKQQQKHNEYKGLLEHEYQIIFSVLHIRELESQCIECRTVSRQPLYRIQPQVRKENVDTDDKGYGGGDRDDITVHHDDSLRWRVTCHVTCSLRIDAHRYGVFDEFACLPASPSVDGC